MPRRVRPPEPAFGVTNMRLRITRINCTHLFHWQRTRVLRGSLMILLSVMILLAVGSLGVASAQSQPSSKPPLQIETPTAPTASTTTSPPTLCPAIVAGYSSCAWELGPASAHGEDAHLGYDINAAT